MNIKHMHKMTALIVALLAFAVTTANALTTAEKDAVVKTFKKAKNPEVAFKAKQAVQQAPASDKEQVALTIVRTVVPKKPNLAATVVSAIAQVAPETAPAIAAEASKLLKNKESTDSIAVAAAVAAPEQSEKVIQLVSAAVPSASAKVTTRVRSTVRNAATPGSGGTISTTPGVLRGIPYTPPVPPTPPTVAPTPGFDPARNYAQP